MRAIRSYPSTTFKSRLGALARMAIYRAVLVVPAVLRFNWRGFAQQMIAMFLGCALLGFIAAIIIGLSVPA